MAISKNKNLKLIPFPSIYIWAAAQIALAEGRNDDLSKILEIYRESTSHNSAANTLQANRELRFLKSIKTKISKGVIPFERSEVDLLLAKSIYGETGGGFKIYSDNSYVPNGFLRVRKNEIEYADCSIDMIRFDLNYPEILNATDKRKILDLLEQIKNESTIYQTLNEGERILKISGEFKSFPKIKKPIDCLISIWNAPEKKQLEKSQNRGLLNRRLGKATLKSEGERSLVLSNVSAQSQLEMTAASMVGRWLLIESDELKVFGQLPDLTEDDDRKNVAFDPSPILKKFMLDSNPMSYLQETSAIYISKLHRWCVPDDAQTWLEAIAP